jgi:hypothetical protein
MSVAQEQDRGVKAKLIEYWKAAAIVKLGPQRETLLIAR